LQDNLEMMLILYAEDDFEDFDAFCEVVKTIDPSIQCVNAKNGIVALDFLENTTILPDLIFLDINMPTMDGKSCLKHIKKDKRFSDIPVVVYTTSTSQQDKEQCIQLGAREYIQKGNTVKEAATSLTKFFASSKLNWRS
jgi:CheY-like chemotaxis protein